MKNQEALKQQGDVIGNIANLLRGPYRPPQYRRVMIPLTVLRRLDCVPEATKDKGMATGVSSACSTRWPRISVLSASTSGCSRTPQGPTCAFC